MTRRLLLGYLSLTAFVLVVLEIPLGITFARFERSQLRAGVRRDAAALALAAAETLETGRGPRLDALAEQYALRTGGRAVIVDAAGNVRGDSDPLREGPRNFSSRPEVEAALSNREVVGRRYSESLGTSLLYVAVPVATGGEVRGAVRVTYPESFVDARVRRGWLVLLAVGLTVLAFVFLLSIQLARSVTRPLRDLELAASRMGEGDLGARVAVPDGPPELRVLARSFNETADKLERLLNQQRRFAADASHQLRTPLAALRLRLENAEALVQGGPADASEAADDVAGAVAEVHRLSRMVDGLLALARAEQGVSLPRAAVDLSSVVSEAAVRWGPLVEEHGVVLSVSGGSAAFGGSARSGVWVLAAPGHLEQVIDNLVANAVDLAPPGSTVSVRVDVVDDEAVELHVIDSGPGMTAEQRAAAFDRFWRSTEARSKLGGSGLGLSIVQQLVVNDGGSVELFEAAGGGLDACVRLVRTVAPAAAGAGGARGGSRAGSRGDGGSRGGSRGDDGAGARARARRTSRGERGRAAVAASHAPPETSSEPATDAAAAAAAAADTGSPDRSPPRRSRRSQRRQPAAEPGPRHDEPGSGHNESVSSEGAAALKSSSAPESGAASSEWRNRQTR